MYILHKFKIIVKSDRLTACLLDRRLGGAVAACELISVRVDKSFLCCAITLLLVRRMKCGSERARVTIVYALQTLKVSTQSYVCVLVSEMTFNLSIYVCVREDNTTSVLSRALSSGEIASIGVQIMGVWELCPSGVQGHSPRGLRRSFPEAESFLLRK